MVAIYFLNETLVILSGQSRPARLQTFFNESYERKQPISENMKKKTCILYKKIDRQIGTVVISSFYKMTNT